MLTLGAVPLVMPDPGAIPEITPAQHNYEDIRLRLITAEQARRTAFWSRLQAIGVGGLAALTLAGALYAWYRTGTLPASRRGVLGRTR